MSLTDINKGLSGVNPTGGSGVANAFETIASTGQDDIVASGETTVNIEAGTGISITTNAGTDTLTITNTGASSSGGWTDDGTVVRLTTAADQVAEGTNTPIDDAKHTISSAADDSKLLLILSNDNVSANAAAKQEIYATTSTLRFEARSSANSSHPTETLVGAIDDKLNLYGNTGFSINVNNPSDPYDAASSVIVGDSTGNVGIKTGAGAINAGFQINSSLLYTPVVLGNFLTGGPIGTAADTVDSHPGATIAQTTAGQTLTIPAPINTAAGRSFYILNKGTVSFNIEGFQLSSGSGVQLFWNGTIWSLTRENSGDEVTVAATGADFTTIAAAVDAGNSKIVVIGDNTETRPTYLTQNLDLTVLAGVDVGMGINNFRLVAEGLQFTTEVFGSFIYSPTTPQHFTCRIV